MVCKKKYVSLSKVEGTVLAHVSKKKKMDDQQNDWEEMVDDQTNKAFLVFLHSFPFIREKILMYNLQHKITRPSYILR